MPDPAFRLLQEAGLWGFQFRTATGEFSWTARLAQFLDYGEDDETPCEDDETPCIDRFLEHIDTGDRDRVTAVLTTTADGETVRRFECWMTGRSGQQVHVECTVSQAVDGSGGVESVGICRVLTELQQSGDLAEYGSDLFRSLAESLPGVVYQCRNDEFWSMLFLNDRIMDLTGYSKRQLLSGEVKFSELIHPDDVNYVSTAIAVALNKYQPFYLLYRLLHRDGSVRWVEEAGGAVRSGDRIVCLQGYINDITERKASEERLRESEAMLRTLSDATFECIFLSDKGVCIGQNRTAGQEFGYTLEEALGRYGTEWIVPEDREEVMQNMLSGFAGPYEVVALRKDGSTFPCEIKGRMIKHQGKLIRVTSLRNISERKKAEAALDDQRQRYQLALRGAELGTWDWYIASGQVRFNKRWAEMLGYEVEEIAPDVSAWEELVHPDDLPGVIQTLNDHLEGRTDVYETRHRLLRKDGRWAWVLDRGKVLEWDSEGKPSRAAGTHLDITHQVETELEFARILETAIDGFWIVDNRGYLVQVNEAAAKILGYTAEEMLGMHLSAIDKNEDHQAVESRIALLKQQQSARFEARHLKKDGSEIDVEVSASFVPFTDGRFVVFVRDITERKQAEEAIRLSRERLDLAIKAGGLVVWDWDIVHDRLDWDEHVTRVYGVESAGQMSNIAAWARLLHPDDLTAARESIRAAQAGECELDFDFRVVHPSGEVRYLHGMGFVIRGHDGKPLRMVGFNQDVTERREAELALAESERRYRSLYERAPVGIFTTNSRGEVVEVNQTMARIVGFDSSAEALDHYENLATDLYVDSDRRREFIEEIQRTGSVENFEYEAQAVDGRRIWLGMSARIAWVGEGGNFVIEGFTQDITERKQAVQAAQESARRTREIFNAVSDAVFMHPWQEEGFANFVDVNKTACERYGYTREEFLRIAPPQISRQSDVAEHAMPPHRRKLHDLRRMTFEAFHVTKSGEEFPVEINSAVIEIDGRKMILAVVRDITERKRAEAERLNLEQQLRQSQKMEALGVLAGGIAHDFNNLLFAILGYADLARGLISPKHPVSPMLEEIVTSSQRASDLVKQILTFARRTERSRQPIDLVPLVKEVGKMMRSTQPANIEIKVQVDVDQAVVSADPTEVHQVLMNLCTNAGHAMRDQGGVLTIVIDRCQTLPPEKTKEMAAVKLDCIRLEVRDTGGGIPEGIRNQIFDPFFTTKDIGEGTGMGLAVVQSVIAELHGWIEVDSQPDQGASFVVHLPEAKTTESSSEEQQEMIPMGTERIIVVDDEPAIAGLVEQVLDELGYDVTAFTDSNQAEEHFRVHAGEYDLAILDHAMPRQTGAELAAKMLGLRPGFPVIIATGYSASFTEAKARDLGVRLYLQKPVDRAVLARTVREVLDELL